MYTYPIVFNRDSGFSSYILIHEKEFSKEEMDSMVNQAQSEMKWSGIKRTYKRIDNYLIDQFGFKREDRRVFEYEDK